MTTLEKQAADLLKGKDSLQQLAFCAAVFRAYCRLAGVKWKYAVLKIALGRKGIRGNYASSRWQVILTNSETEIV